MSSKSSSDTLARIRNRKRISSVEPRVDPLAPNSPVQLISLNQITDRTRDTRPINMEHVAQLVESIRVVGLITPLAIDREFTLLAGAHRLEALKTLARQDPEHFQRLFSSHKVPARIMDISANTDQLLALRVEIEENEKRRDYTPAEVLEVAQTLESAGFTRSRGRPLPGEKPLIPALEAIFGKSKATIKRYLAQEEKEKTTDHLPVNPEVYMWHLAHEKCTKLAQKLSKVESELLRAQKQWSTDSEMKKEVEKHEKLGTALEVSIFHLNKAIKSLQIK